METGKPIDTLRMKSSDRMRILEALDEKASEAAATVQNRVQTRFEYRAEDVLLRVYGDGMDSRRFFVCARNISSGGMAFLHGGFLHTGTRCEVCLVQLSGVVNQVRGRIVRCRHVAGRIHEIGMVFDSKIDVEAYHKPQMDDIRRALRAEAPAEMPRITGRVLCIHHDMEQCRNILTRLRGAGARIFAASYLGKGLDTIRRSRFDVVICETDLEEARGPAAIRYVRKAGFMGGLMSIRDQEAVYSVEQLVKAGASKVLTAPVMTRELVTNVAELTS